MIYLSEAEYQMSLSESYKGMTDEDVIELMSCEEIRIWMKEKMLYCKNGWEKLCKENSQYI